MYLSKKRGEATNLIAQKNIVKVKKVKKPKRYKRYIILVQQNTSNIKLTVHEREEKERGLSLRNPDEGPIPQRHEVRVRELSVRSHLRQG